MCLVAFCFGLVFVVVVVVVGFCFCFFPVLLTTLRVCTID